MKRPPPTGALVNPAAAAHHLRLLGKDPLTVRIRAFAHKDHPLKDVPEKHGGIGARKRIGINAADFTLWQREGRSIYLVVNDGGDTKASITACRAFWAEWDDRPLAWQLTAWQELGLPEPTFILVTGGKSAHLYWVLSELIPVEQWHPLQVALVAHAKADRINDPSRVLRLAGCSYIGPDGKPHGMAEIVHESGRTYTAEQIAAALPHQPLTTETAAPAAASGHEPIVLNDPIAPDLPPRTLAEVREALSFIPTRFSGSYSFHRNVLWGLIDAVKEAGGTLEDAINLMESHCPSNSNGWNIPQVARSGNGSVRAGTFWLACSEHGFSLKATRTQPRQQQPGPAATDDAPRPDRPARSPLLTLEQVRLQLQESIAEGISSATLAELVATLSGESDQPAHSIHRIADALIREQGQAAAVAAEAQQIAAEADRQEIGQAITPAFLLPLPIAEAIETRTRYLPTDGPAAVLPFLAAVSGMVKLGTRVEACRAAGYHVPINLFACLVGRSGAKKSPVGRLLVDEPTHSIRADLAASNRDAMERWREDCKGIKKGEPKPDPPPIKRLMVSDFTGEALAVQLEVQEAAGLGVLIHRDELSGLFGSLNAYRSGRGGDEQQLLELFDGGGSTSIRIGGQRCHSRSQVSIWGGTQPDVLRQLVADGDASGLWARFLFVPLPARPVPLPLHTTRDEVAAVEAAARTLADACGRIYRFPPATYRLSLEASEAFASYELARQETALSAPIAAQSSLFGKSAGKVLRLAGLFHLLQRATGAAESEEEISAGTISRAIALVDHLDAWALSLHAEVAAGSVGGLMRTVHRVAESVGRPIRWKDLAQRVSSKQRKDTDAAGFAEAAAALHAAGYGEAKTGQRGSVSYQAIKPLP